MSSPLSSEHLTDFSDRLSPMLVKELRQGMRTHLFTIAFILLQAFMVLCVLLGASAPGDGSSVSGFFWFFIVVALLLVMPIRGFGALTSEIQLNTMDLIQLTELGAWRVTFGKWAALVAQSLLLVCGVLPYVVMRYFFGGVDLFSELIALFWVLIFSMVLTAITVGFSAFKSILLRSTIAVGILFLNVIGPQFVTAQVLGVLFDPIGSGKSGSVIGWSFAAGIISAAYLIWFMLDLGASRIAPESDNHSTRKRLVALLFGVFVMLLPLAGLEVVPCLVIAGSTWMLVTLDALTERPTLIPSVLRPFAGRIYLRPFAFLLSPGWPSGIFFYLLCVALFALAFTFHNGFRSPTTEELQVGISSAGIVVFPLIIIHLFFRRITEPTSLFGIYLLIQVCTGVIAFFLMIMAEESGIGGVAYYFAPAPMTLLFGALAGSSDAGGLLLSAIFGGLAVLITIIRGFPWYRDSLRIMAALRAPNEE